MKITAEFNSVEEVLAFASTFGAKAFIPEQGVQAPVITKESKPVEMPIKKEEPSKVEETPKEEAAATKEESEVKTDPDPKEESKPEITKEMVRAKFNEIIKAGKQKEAKELVAKFGASKLPDVDPKHYEELMKEAEALL
jgi:hypothetical protein